MNKEKQYDVLSRNEMLSLMYENSAEGLRSIADCIEKFQLTNKEPVKLLREIADEQDAQSIVVSLRDEV